MFRSCLICLAVLVLPMSLPAAVLPEPATLGAILSSAPARSAPANPPVWAGPRPIARPAPRPDVTALVPAHPDFDRDLARIARFLDCLSPGAARRSGC